MKPNKPTGSARRFALLALFSLILAAPAAAQVTGRLSATVQDPQSHPVQGARVVLYLAESDVEDSSTVTNAEGNFLFPVVRPGFYQLTVEATGFQKITIQSVKVDPLAETSLPTIALVVGPLTVEQKVIAPAETLNTSDGQVSATIRSDEVSQLPVFQRNPLNLLDTLPGVGSSGRVDPFTGGSPRVINGQSVSFSNITYDGINVQTSFIRSNVLNFITNGIHSDQLSEMTVVTVNPSSAYSGGSVQVAFSTPQGGNKLHVGGYWTYLPRGTAAQDWLDNRFGSPTKVTFNQVGGVVSGPVIKNKVFYFLNYEGLFDRSTITNETSVPQLTSSDPVFSKVLAQIPASNEKRTLIDNLGNSTDLNYRITQNAYTDRHIGLARLDWQKSTRNVFSATFSIQHAMFDDNGNSVATLKSPNVVQRAVSPFYSLSWRSTVSPSLTNEFRAGANLPSLDFGNTQRTIFPFVLTYFGSSYDWNPTGGSERQGRNDYAYNFQDNLSWTRGRHSVRAGFSAQLYRLDTYGYNRGSTGPYEVPVYDMAATDKNLTNWVVDQVSQSYTLTGPSLSYTSGAIPKSKLNANLFSGYFQDDFRATPKLTLNLGLRYDYLTPVKETTGTALIPQLGSNIYSTLYQQNFQFGFKQGGLYNADRKDFAPYAGLAWKFLPNMVFRGAYSISHVNDDLLRNMDSFSIGGLWQGLIESQPAAANTTLSSMPKVQNVILPAKPDLQSLLNGSANGTTPPRAVDPNLKTPYVQQWNVGVEREVNGWLFTARYVGNRLVKGLRAIDVDQVMLPQAYLQSFRSAITNINNGVLPFPNMDRGQDFGGLPAAFYPCAKATNGFTSSIIPNGCGESATIVYYLQTGQAADLARFYQLNNFNTKGAYSLFANPNGGRYYLLSNLGRSRYDSMQLTASGRIAGLTILGNYTFGKVLSNLNDYSQGATDPYLDIKNPRLDRARAPIDVRHAIKARWIYNLPFGNGHNMGSGKLAPALGGWTLSGVFIVQSGAPFSLLSGLGTYNISLDSAYRNTLTSTLTVPQIAGRENLTFDGLGPRYFTSTSSELSQPLAGAYGNLPLRAFDGPWQKTVNIGLHKRFYIKSEASYVEVRGEAFNLMNHPNWVIPDQFLGNNAIATTAGGPLEYGRDAFQSNLPRRVQFTVRVSF